MESSLVEIRIKGENHRVPSTCVGGRTIIVTGKWIKLAAVMDEELVEGETVKDPESFVTKLKRSNLRADIFTFAQRLPELSPSYGYHLEWDNWAAIPITCFNDWWEKRLPQESRKNVRRAGKRGVVAKVVAFSDELVYGIHGIYNETPIRQGRPFWHFGKDFETVKRENGTYLDRSEFLGAYLDEELIGFIKIIYVERIAALIQILAKNEHHDKRPMNALLAKAVEVCESRGASLLVYGKYVYGQNQGSPLTEFKRRNGFEEIRYPRYFVPLTPNGKIAIWSGLHRGVRNLLPAPIIRLSLNLRSRFYRKRGLASTEL